MRGSRPNRRHAGLLLLSGLFAGPLAAQVEVDGGHVFPAQARVAGVALQLNGVGYRAVAWFKGYAAALYLTQRVRTVPEVLATPGPKRLQMKMLVDVPSAEFVKAFGKGVSRNTPAAEVATLRDRMQEFDALVNAIGTVRKGDLVDLDFVPGQGLQLSLNGRPRGAPIPGEDLYAALLRIFVGDRPVDKEMKVGLLGGPVG